MLNIIGNREIKLKENVMKLWADCRNKTV